MRGRYRKWFCLNEFNVALKSPLLSLKSIAHLCFLHVGKG